MSIVGSRAALELDEQVAAVTVTVNEQLAEFLDGSRATNVLVVAPRGNTDPDASPAVCVTFAWQLSTGTGGKYLTVEKHCDTENDRGHEMLGGWLSVTVTVTVQVDDVTSE